MALWLIGLLGVYIFLGTLVPQGAAQSPEVAAWAARHPVAERVVGVLGFHGAYSTPLFLLLISLLFVSTTLCAWERTRAAVRDLRGIGQMLPSRLERLRRAPTREIGHDVHDVPGHLARGLRRPGTVVRSGPRLTHVVTGVWGPVGSAVFHVCLALLLVTIGLGRLTRSEGFAGAVDGGPAVSLSVRALRQATVGSLHTDRYRDLSVRVTRFESEYRADGVLYRDTPYVELVRGDTVLAGQWVHANNPLRHGSLLIHRSDFGGGVIVTVRDPVTGTSASETLLLDFDPAEPSGLKTGAFAVEGVEGAPALEVSVTLTADMSAGKAGPDVPTQPLALIVVRSADGTAPIEMRLRAGEGKTLPSGVQLQVDRIARYARLSVVDDPSVYPIYVIFALAALALSVAILQPFGQAWVLLEGDGDARVLRVAISSRRAGPAFAERVEKAVASVTVSAARDDADHKKETL